MRELYGVVVAWGLVVGCGSSSTPATGTARLELGGTSVVLGGLTFDTTRVGATNRVSLTIVNSGDEASGLIAAQTTGDPAFSIDPGSDCPGQALAASASCTLTLAFAPQAVGGVQGELLVVASPGGMITIPLGGDGGALGIVFDPAMIDFGSVEVGHHTTVVHATNTAAEALPITAVSVNGPVFSATTDCGASLGAGASCDITVAIDATQLGTAAATLTIDSAGNPVSAPITALVGGRVTVEKAGNGAGTVTSSVGGIDCGATCVGIVSASTTLTASPAAGSTFIGWSESSCGSALTCTLPPDAVPRTIVATFGDPSGTTVTIQLAGNASGVARVTRQTASGDIVADCTGSCQLPASVGDTIQVVGISASTVTGWTGACTTTTTSCSFVFTGNTTATVTFARDAKEEWSRVLLPGSFARSAAFDSLNRLVVGTSAGVVALDASGATRWFVAELPDPTDPLGVAKVPAGGRAVVGANDDVFVVAGRTLAKLDATGAVAWSVDLGSSADLDPAQIGSPVAVSPNGDVAVQVGATLKVYATTGSPRWTVPNVPAAIGVVAIDSAGNISTVRESPVSPETMTAARFSPAGVALTMPNRISQQYRAALAFDSLDSYVTTSSGHSRLYFERWQANGSNVFTTTKTITGISYFENGVAVADDDRIVGVEALGDQQITGFLATRRSPTGVIDWSMSRPALSTPAGGVAGDTPHGLAVDHQGKVAVVGSFDDLDAQPHVVVQLFAP